MREYELIFIVHPDLEETATNEVVERVQGWITEAGGKINKVDPWGKRRLAASIAEMRRLMVEARAPALAAGTP